MVLHAHKTHTVCICLAPYSILLWCGGVFSWTPNGSHPVLALVFLGIWTLDIEPKDGYPFLQQSCFDLAPLFLGGFIEKPKETSTKSCGGVCFDLVPLV